MSGPYNPLDKMNLGRSVADALLMRPVAVLAEASDLVGAGVYAIYYTGDFAPYQPVAGKNRDNKYEQPIYVGKAVPKGARRGGLTFDASRGKALRDRLQHHTASIREARNLRVEDFQFRSLTIDDIWIPLGENMMIELYRPVWNVLIDGFGNKTPGKGRQAQRRASWDVLHPGRLFAEPLADGGATSEMIVMKLESYFGGKAVPLIPPDEAVDEGVSEDDQE
jgi:Eco29kI restriction endonuclease